MALHKKQLDKAMGGGCMDCADGHAHPEMFFHGRCHPHADVETSYVAGKGIVRIACVECHALIAEIAVAA